MSILGKEGTNCTSLWGCGVKIEGGYIEWVEEREGEMPLGYVNGVMSVDGIKAETEVWEEVGKVELREVEELRV